MSRRGQSRQRGSQGRLRALLRRVFLGPPEELEAPGVPCGLEAYELEPPNPDPWLHITPTPLRDYLSPEGLYAPGWREPTNAELRQYVDTLTDPDLKLPPLDPPMDETRFDLIRVHPYNPPREGTWRQPGGTWSGGYPA